MKYLIVGLTIFGLFSLISRFTPTLLMTAGLPILICGAVVMTVMVSHRVK